MTVTDFLKQCEQQWGGGKIKLMPAQEAAYRQKLSMFSEEQLSAIYDKVLELAEHFPKIKNVYDAARMLGFLETHMDNFEPHHWQDAPCGLCHGEGRLAIIWAFKYEDRQSGRVEIQTVADVVQYSQTLSTPVPDKQFRTIFRCQCSAGDASTLPKAWPKFTKHTPLQREVWI